MKYLFAATLLLSSAAQAVPTVTANTMERTGEYVTVTFTLTGAPAVVTLDVTTNGCSIGRNMIGLPMGEGHVLLKQDGTYRMKWSPAALFAAGVKELTNARAVLTAWGRNRMPDYLVCDLTGKDVPRYYVDEADLPGGQGASHRQYKTEKLLMKFIPAKDVVWIKGAATNEPGFVSWNLAKGTTGSAAGQKLGNFGGEVPSRVRLSQNYYLGVYEVTQSQYQFVTGTNPSYFTNAAYAATRPVERVAYSQLRGTDATYWPAGGHERINDDLALKTFRDVTGLASLDLPTEAQWEFACRAGSSMPYSNGRHMTSSVAGNGYENAYAAEPALEAIARYSANACDRSADNGVVTPSGDSDLSRGTSPVGSYQANGFGLYDMHGNVFEWCLDYCNVWPEQPAGAIVLDPDGGPQAQSLLSTRVQKGGSYQSSARCLRSAARRFQGASGAQSTFGFRLCLTLD